LAHNKTAKPLIRRRRGAAADAPTTHGTHPPQADCL